MAAVYDVAGGSTSGCSRHRRWSDVRSDEINEYLKEHAGADFSAKDFRTWNATVLAAVTSVTARGMVASSSAGVGRVPLRSIV